MRKTLAIGLNTLVCLAMALAPTDLSLAQEQARERQGKVPTFPPGPKDPTLAR